ncbi:MAG TPA: flagellar motor switch phosphatase FliY [Patescibacteria group bacterium]|nr:flagellar motor switch phosphatase FliY [Patescibacteria group bacterium]
MSDGFLSQEEIDALLRGDPASAPGEEASAATDLTDLEKDALGEIGNISMGTAATTLSILLGKRVSITTPRVTVTTLNQIKNQYPLPYLIVEVGYTQGLLGTNLLAMREQDALIIADLMMGNDGTNPPATINELYMSAVTEAMNQMMGSTATSISTIFKKKVDIAPPTANLVDFATTATITDLASAEEPVVRVAFRIEVEDLIDSEIMQIVSYEVAKEMVENLLNSVQPASAPAAPPQVNAPAAPAAPAAAAAAPAAAYSQPVAAAPRMNQNVTVQPAQFAPIRPVMSPVQDANLALIMDVPLEITVELGRTKKLIRDILELGTGSVIELDKLAGEPVDILVNGKLIAKGEVVVIDENFGVRITDIISPMERLTTLQ